MKFPESCPICQKGPITVALQDYAISVSVSGQEKPLGGLIALQCSQEFHIFFVMTKDVEERYISQEELAKAGNAIKKTSSDQLQEHQ